MRTGGYTLQHSLTPESATIVKQAFTLARRRGHAHVTPLHVASSMMASTTGLLKTACLQCHSHPLQCKALELCFNVALNRLPTSASSPFLGPHSHLPSLSNALVAAFKRAQAHQRRGSVENQQQQSILALKVEVEQLVISILDDPSVSRVMREAGFSSTQVKTNVEQALKNSESSKPQQSHQLKDLNPKPLFLENNISHFSYNQKQVQNDDVSIVLEAMMNKRTKNTVIIVESSATAENLVKGIIDKFDKKDVPLEMRFVQFISVPLYTLRNISREEFEIKLVELRSLLKTHLSTGVVLYLGDLHWVSEFWSNYGEQKNNAYYSPVEYMIMELSRLICGTGENKRLWLIGTATYETYAKCKSGRPSLETLWSLSPLTIPVATSLSLSLSLVHSDHSRKQPLNEFSWLFQKAAIKNQLNCCSDCLVNFNREAQGVMSGKQEFTPSTSRSSLPLWLKQYKDENVTKRISCDDQEQEKLKHLCTKWNSICNSVHRKPHFLEKIINMSTPSPSSSTSVSSNNPNKCNLKESHPNWPVIFKPLQNPKEHYNFLCENEDETSKPTIPDLLSNPNSSPNSASSSEASADMNLLCEFKEHNLKNLEILCHALGKKVPWQKDIIPDIATTVLKCRSGKMKTDNREESWFCFLGADSDGKETIARELAKVLFGSYENFISISLSSFSLTRGDSNDEVSNNKRARDEHGASPYERFLDSIRDNPSRVFFLEDIDQFDYVSLSKFKRVIESGSFTLPDGETVYLKDTIVIFSCVNFSASRACSPLVEMEFELQEKADENGVLDLNIATEDGYENECAIRILDFVDKQVVFEIQVL